MKMKCAPIVLFVFNRLDHTTRAVEALRQNKLAQESILYIYSDGARNPRDVDAVEAVRAYCRRLTGFADVHLVEREENWGIEKSEIAALTELFQTYEACIVLEDDLQVSSSFLEYMNRALVRYRDEKQVISIAGYSHIDERSKKARGQEFYFSQLITSWGWATWADRWCLFDDKNFNLDIISTEEEQRRFDMGGTCPYTKMLKEQLANHSVTWDVAWYFRAFERGLLTLTPVCTMVNNLGMDGSGVHYSNDAIDNNRKRQMEREYVFDFPEKVALDAAMQKLEQAGMQKEQRRERRKYRAWKLRTMVQKVFCRKA